MSGGSLPPPEADAGLAAPGPPPTGDISDAEPVRRFRSLQIAGLQKYAPIMMLGNVVNATLLASVAWQAELQVFALLWFLLILSYSAMAIRSWWRSRRRDTTTGAPAWVARRAILHALILGTAWGLAALVTYPAASPQGQTVVAVITGGMIYGGGFALAAVPAAMNAYLAPLVVGAVGALALDRQPIDLVLAVPLLVFSFIIQRAGVGHARLLSANFEDRERLAEQSHVISLLLHDFERGTNDWLWQIDRHGRLQRGTEQIAEATNLPIKMLLECDFRQLTTACCEDPGCHSALLQQHLANGTAFRGIEVHFPDPKASRWLRFSGHPLFDAMGARVGFRGVASDISAEKTAEQRIAFLARHDALTGLLNRSSFGEELDLLHATGQIEGGNVCLLYLDLDGFKEVNDTRGHASGDRLLVDTAHRIADATGTAGTVARLGGDEFAVLLPDTERERALHLASRLILALGEPLSIDGDLVRIGVSIGIAFAGPEADTPAALISAADLALYCAKKEGRNTSRVFDSEMRATATKQQKLQQDLRFAVERNELKLHYQPIVRADSAAIEGLEALLRWHHPAHGLLSAAQFIHLAEAGGTIHDIGRWVAREACRAAVGWPSQIFVSINLSPQQFRSADLVVGLADAIGSSGLEPHRLRIELTESVLIEDAVEVAENLLALRKLGLSVALDDFGTGYSSFGYLTTFGFDSLKIDRSLVLNCDTDQRARSVLEAIIAMSRALELETIAEGVETDEHAIALRSLGCDLLQGYFFARPLTPEQAQERLG